METNGKDKFKTKFFGVTGLFDKLADYEHNGTIPKELIPGFNQHGKWVGVHAINIPVEIPSQILAKLEKITLPPEVLFETGQNGESIFNGSFIWETPEPVQMDYHLVRGDIRISSLQINAPNLLAVIGSIEIPTLTQTLEFPQLKHANSLRAPNAQRAVLPQLESINNLALETAEELEIPLLQEVGNLLAPCIKELIADELKYVTDYLTVTRATRIQVNNLETVGVQFGAQNATSFIAPKLEIQPQALYAQKAPQFTHTEANGEKTLKCSYGKPWKSCMETDFTIIEGNVSTGNAMILLAPNLIHIGGGLSGDYLNRLKTPKLESVTESLSAWLATDIQAPRLKTVGKNLITPAAKDFHNPTLRVGQTWQPHPDAKKHWEIRQNTKRALRSTPSLEI